MSIRRTVTQRGFGKLTFEDRYGAKCSLQASSLASEEAIWLGLEDAEPKILARDAEALGVHTEEKVGWIPYFIPRAVLLNTRMHLTREQVAELIPVLQQFVDSGMVDVV